MVEPPLKVAVGNVLTPTTAVPDVVPVQFTSTTDVNV